VNYAAEMGSGAMNNIQNSLNFLQVLKNLFQRENTQTYRHKHTYTYICIYIYICGNIVVEALC
jgi:hypothetical protein